MNKTISAEQVNYPSLSQRYFATALDVVFVIVCVFMVVQILTALNIATDQWQWFMVLIPVFTYEPLLTSKAVTLGQWVFGFRVRDVITGQKIGVIQAYGRWIIKFLLGGISLLTIPNDTQKRAIHDKMLATVAVSQS